MRSKRIIALITSLLMTASLSGCGNTEPSGKQSAETSAVTTEAAPADSSEAPETAETSAPEEEPAEPESLIRRKTRTDEKPMGEDGTWTIFVYLCGSNLETQKGAATSDLLEMIGSSANENVRFVVQTGGSNAWQSNVSADECERYVVEDGDCALVDSCGDANMGDSSTLADFIKWGIEEYPAANMGLIFWDHGCGSLGGVCMDEKHNCDTLFLKEIDAALYSVYDDMTEPFEFIGFDCCIMSTAETAAIMATHAKYLVASQEIIPDDGWNYTALGDYLAENPECDGEELGKAIVDSYFDTCKKNHKDSGVSLSLIDLSKMDAFIEAFDAYSKDIYELCDNSAEFSALARKINAVDNFGGNTRASGYTNMIDIGGLINAGADCSDNAEAALEALSNAVIYTKKGTIHPASGGLSVFYPLYVEGSAELCIFRDIALSAYYLGFVDKVAYGAVNGEVNGYDNSALIEAFPNDWSSDGYTENSDGSLNYQVDLSGWDYTEDYAPGDSNTNIVFDTEPGMHDGSYSFVLSQDCIGEVDHIEGGVFAYDEENGFAIELGSSGDVYGDFGTGEFIDGFDGYWFTLSDDQLISAYLLENCDGYDLYASPILLNGEPTFLRFAYYFDDEDENGKGRAEILDIWDGIGESGAADRSGSELKNGDVIVPRYYCVNLNSDSGEENDFFEGDELKYGKDTAITMMEMSDSDYLYCFYIYDIYGNYSTTDFIRFTIRDDGITYREF